MISIKDFFLKIKSFFIKKIYVFFIISICINIFLLLFYIRINVSMSQSQYQQLNSSVYNVNNNQNINFNFAFTSISQSRPSFTNEKINNLLLQINKLNLYQQHFLKIYNGYIYYPEMNVGGNIVFQSNYSVVFNTNKNEIKTWLDFLKK